MRLSIIMPYINDDYVLDKTLPELLKEVPKGECEVIIIDNGSYIPLKITDPRVKVIRIQTNKGVGMAFNLGVERALSDNIVITGCDVIPQEGWYDRVLETLAWRENIIFCSVSSGFSDKIGPFGLKSVRRYGAHILYKVTKQDLPSSSPIQKDPKFSNILQGKWNYRPGKEGMPSIGCLMGAFYWMHKSTYRKLHGWNGHKMWGSLEPQLSIKARAHGVKLLVDRQVDAAHYYGRSVLRPGRGDLRFYNMLFMAHTMFSDALRDELIEYLRYGGRREKVEKLNVNQARIMIKRNHGLVQAERDYNNKHFKHGLISNWDKFNTEMI